LAVATLAPGRLVLRLGLMDHQDHSLAVGIYAAITEPYDDASHATIT